MAALGNGIPGEEIAKAQVLKQEHAYVFKEQKRPVCLERRSQEEGGRW